MAKYKVTFPYIDDMGSVSPITATSCASESAQENALWHLNNMRGHDGLRALGRLPAGTRLELIEENAPSKR